MQELVVSCGDLGGGYMSYGKDDAGVINLR